MALAYKLLDRNGTSTKGGGKSWPLPTDNRIGAWISTIHGKGKYYLCKRNNIVLWIDHALFIAEFKEIIKEHHGDLEVPDARLVMRVHNWNNVTQKDFMKNCLEYSIKRENLSDPNKQKYVEQLERAYEANNLMRVSKFAVHLAEDPTEETNRQNDLIWQYVQDEIIDCFSEDKFA